jgi:hypothetical protein
MGTKYVVGRKTRIMGNKGMVSIVKEKGTSGLEKVIKHPFSQSKNRYPFPEVRIMRCNFQKRIATHSNVSVRLRKGSVLRFLRDHASRSPIG